MRFVFGFIIGFILSGMIVFADNISAPPPIPDPSVYHYFRQIYENFHRLQVVTANPDGTRNGKKGDMLHLQTGGNYYHCENVDSSTTWRCIQLLDVP